MKKNFVKKLAAGLAFTMVVTMLPANDMTASAAAAIKFSKYLDNVYSGKTYTYTVKNVKKGYKVKYTVSGDAKAAITLNKKSATASGTSASFKVTVDASSSTKNKTATVKATVYNKSGKKVGSKGDKITIKADATDVAIKTDKFDTGAMVVNESYDMDRTLTPSYSTNKTYWSVDSEDATIDSQGVFKATKAGTYKVTATVKRTKNATVVRATKEIEVTVKKAAMASVKQSYANKIVAKVVGDTAGLKASDFTVARTDNAVFPIKEITVDSKDATQVTIETYSDMKDAKEYTVTYDGTTASFTATNGTVADINVTPSVITAGKKKDVKVQTVDATGVVLSEANYGKQDSKIDFELTSSTGYTEGSKLYLPKVGDTAKAKVTYHTYQYDTTGTETGAITKEFTITAVEDDATVTNYKMTILDAGSTPAWDATTFTANSQLVIGENSEVFLQIKDSEGDEVEDYSEYKIVSSDASRMLLTETTLSGSKNGNGVSITGVAEGTAYVIVKDAQKDTTLTTIPVTVVAERKVVKVELSKTAVTVSKDTPAFDITATAKDQYDSKIKASDLKNYEAEVLTYPGSTSPGTAGINVSGDTITVNPNAIYGANSKYGTYVYKITAKDKNDKTASRTLSVSLVEVSANAKASYSLELSDTKLDTTVTKDTDDAASIDVKVATVKANTVSGYVGVTSLPSIVIKKGSDTIYKSENGVVATSNAAIEVTGDTIKVKGTKKDGKTYTKLLDPASYTVTVKATDANKNDVTLTKSFTVADTQEAASIKIEDQDASGSTAQQYLISTTDKVTYTYQGVEFNVSNVEDVEGTKGNNTVYVKRVFVTVDIPGGNNNSVKLWVNVNRNLTNCSGLK